MKPEIVFICQRVPYPPDRGDRITTWNYLKWLSKKYYIHLFCLNSEKKNISAKKVLSEYCTSVNIYQKSFFKSAWDSLWTLLFKHNTPISNGYYYSSQLTSDLSELLSKKKVQFIYASSSNIFGHIKENAKDIPKIFHFMDVDSEKWKKMAKCGKWWMRPIYNIEFKRLRKWEIEQAHQALLNIFITEQEAALFQGIVEQNVKNFETRKFGKVVSILNGVDSEYFCPNHLRKSFESQEPVAKENAVIFTGVMDYFPNIDTVLCFYREAFPILKEKMPDIKFYIVGSRPTKEILSLSKDPHCIVTGYVSDVRPFFEKAKLFVLPMKVAQGMQNKIVESLAMQVPVIAYPKIVEPLNLTEENGVISSSNPKEMAGKILQLLSNNTKLQELCQAGRKTVLERYRWENCLAKLDKLLEENIPTEKD